MARSRQQVTMAYLNNVRRRRRRLGGGGVPIGDELLAWDDEGGLPVELAWDNEELIETPITWSV